MIEYKKLLAFKHCVKVFREYKIYHHNTTGFDTTIITMMYICDDFFFNKQSYVDKIILTKVVKILTCNPTIHNNRWIKRQLKVIKKDHKLDF